jgi:hypothetical protein
MLYGAAWRVARAMGYRKIITYTLKSEHGTSLKAAGWNCTGEAGCLEWKSNRERRRNPLPLERDLPPHDKKLRYQKCLPGQEKPGYK